MNAYGIRFFSALLVVWSMFFAAATGSRIAVGQTPPEGSTAALRKGVFAGVVPPAKEALLLEHVRNLTAPAMEGRRAAGAGDRLSAAYLAEQFRRSGLVPGGENNTFFQNFQFESWQPMPITGLGRIEGGALRKSYSCEWQSTFSGRDFRPVARCGPGSVTAEVVFAGYGLEEPALGLDDYAGVDARGKIVLLLLGDGPLPAGRRRSEGAVETAKRRGARACLLAYPVFGRPVPDPASPPLLDLSDGDAAAGLPVFSIRNALRDEFLASRGPLGRLQSALDGGTSQSGPLGVTLQLDLRVRHEPGATSLNVIGILPGDDPTLRDEFVVLTTYRDGYGPDWEGRICPGANDNASGLAVMLEAARVLGQIKPARSVLFLAYGAEIGRLSSRATAPGLEYFLLHPTVPTARLAAVFQFDRVGLAVSDRIALDNITLYPDIFLKLRQGLPELSSELVTGGPAPQLSVWPPGIPRYRLNTSGDARGTGGPANSTVLFPPEDTAERLRADALRSYAGLLTRISAYLASSDERLIQPFREHLEAMYRATTIGFAPVGREEFYRRAASVRRDYLTDVLIHVPEAGGKKIEASERRRRFLNELAELRENLADVRSRLRPVRGPADLAGGDRVGDLAADNQIGVWIGLDDPELLAGRNAVPPAELKAAGLHMVYVTERTARDLATEAGLATLQGLQREGVWILVGPMDEKRRRKLVQSVSVPVLIADDKLSDEDLKAFVEAGHFILEPSDAGLPEKHEQVADLDATYSDRILHVLETVGAERLVIGAPPLPRSVVLVAALGRRNVAPARVEALMGGNFSRFYVAASRKPS